MASPHRRRVAYVVSPELIKVSSLLPSNKNRSLIVHSLIHALRLLTTHPTPDDAPLIRTVKPALAPLPKLAMYHTRDYLDYVLAYDGSSTAVEPVHFGLEDDCPPFPGLALYVQAIAGATLTAVEIVRRGQADVAICWDGGRHHAQKSRASGFCYVADCVLAILTLKRPYVPKDPPAPSQERKRPRIMYLDLDLHFSDAVSQAFHLPHPTTVPQVLTLSIHHAAPGFFPTSALASLPDADDPALDPFTLSIPLRQGASDATVARIWPIVERVRDAFGPDVVVVQCGVDGLAQDPCAIWNWSIGGGEGSMGWCVGRIVKEWKGRKILLGGGGYHSPNAARAWAYLTGIALERPLSLDTAIPDVPEFALYAPSFTLDVPAGNMQDTNGEEYLQLIERCYDRVLELIRAAHQT